MEFSFKDKVLSSQEIKDSLKDLNLGEISVQFSEEKNVLLRFKDVDEETHQKIVKSIAKIVLEKNSPEEGDKAESLSENANSDENGVESSNVGGEPDKKNKEIRNVAVETDSESAAPAEIFTSENANDSDATITSEDGSGGEIKVETDNAADVSNQGLSIEDIEKVIDEKRFDSIGPVVGGELKQSAVWAVAWALAAIILYIGWAFRKVSRPVSSFKYGVVATIALFHDVIITLGIFSALGHFYNVEVGVSFVAAILAVLGYSVNDTIVVFDRTRENLLKSDVDDFEEVVNKSVNETLIRSLNTSFTTLLALFAMYLFGGETIRYFVVALFIGIFFGTYSSIFIASPLLVTLQKWDSRKATERA